MPLSRLVWVPVEVIHTFFWQYWSLPVAVTFYLVYATTFLKCTRYFRVKWGIIVKADLEITLKKAAVTHIKVIFKYFVEETEDNREEPRSR